MNSRRITLSILINADHCIIRNYLTLFFLILHIAGFAQVDTARNYYSSGELRSEHPMTNGEVTGLVRYFYKSGEVKSEVRLSKNKTTHKYYYTNGVTRFISTNSSKGKQALYAYYSYSANGVKIKSDKKNSRGRKVKEWDSLGRKTVKEKYKNGEPIGCIIVTDYLDGDSIEREGCYCGATQVFWVDSMYSDRSGNQINKRFKLKRKEYHQNGKLRTKIVQNGPRKKTIIWNNNGKKTNTQIEGVKVAPIRSSTGPTMSVPD